MQFRYCWSLTVMWNQYIAGHQGISQEMVTRIKVLGTMVCSGETAGRPRVYAAPPLFYPRQRQVATRRYGNHSR